jgi:ribosomal protein L3 glutamine methyltransferase
MSVTLEHVIRNAAERMDAADLYFGHGTDNAIDEACWLASAALGMDPDFDPAEFARVLEPDEASAIERLLSARIKTRKPLAYLLGHAWLAGLKFEVSEQVLVPRSPLAELILDGFEPWLPPDRLKRAVDVGTGSGCLAIALAHYWPQVQVDAVDISEQALALARRNAEALEVADRVECIRSDLLDGLAGRRYDLILANPPYVPSASMETLPAEFTHEPRLGLEAGADGLDLVRRLIISAPEHLEDHGVLICEVGEAAEATEALLGEQVDLIWLEFAHGGDGVFLLEAEACRQAAAYLANA